MKNSKIFFYLFTLLLITGCGFQVLDRDQLKDYKILEIKEKRR